MSDRIWNKKFSDNEISYAISKIKEIRTVIDGDNISLSGWHADHWISFFATALDIDVRTQAIKQSIVSHVFFSRELKQDFTESDLRAQIFRMRNAIEKSTKLFKVAFPIWNAPAFLRGVKRLGDVTVNFSPSLTTSCNKKIISERASLIEHEKFEYFFTRERVSDIENCSICIASTKACFASDAQERASEAIFQILGLVNIANDSWKYCRNSFRPRGRLPVSDVLVAPYITVHRETGSLAQEVFWFDNWVGGPSLSSINDEKQRAWEKRYQALARGVRNSVWQKESRIAAVSYYKAFSDPDLRESFLNGWRLFEYISGTQQDSYDLKVERASNLFENNMDYNLLGKHLLLRRNLISHGRPILNDDEEVLVFQILQLVVPFIERFILNALSFTSPKELWEFLELPANREKRTTEKENLRRRLVLLRKAAHFRYEKD